MPERITFTLEVDGAAVSTELQVLSVVVSREVNRVPCARVTLVDGQTNISDFPVSNQETFIPGKTLAIKAGDSGTEERIFKGIIVTHRIRLRPDRQSLLVVEARDAAFQLTLTPKNALFEEATDSDIMEEILSGYSPITPEVEATDVTHLRMVQHQSTDWDFLLARAAATGMLVSAIDHTLRIAPPGLDADPQRTLTFGADVMELDLAMDARSQVAALQARGWNAADQAVASADAAEPALNQQSNLTPAALADAAGGAERVLDLPGPDDESALQARADSRLLHLRMGMITGRVRFQGSAAIQPGMTVALAGFGERFNGTAFVSGVRHELFDGGWLTDIQLGLPAESFSKTETSTRPGALPLPPAAGLQIGKVLQLQDDPDGSERILVHLPLFHPEGAGVWARLTATDAGSERGFVWRPEIDDEVVVGFIGDDPRAPVILGSLHSAANPAPIAASDDNHEKGYVSRSGMRVHFNDEKNILTIDTPGGHQVVLDEDESAITITELNGNTWTMNADGITVDSPADFTLTCAGNATIEAGGNIDLTASGDLTATGANVTAEAGASAKVSGSAGAELSSSGQTKVEGSLVMIN